MYLSFRFRLLLMPSNPLRGGRCEFEGILAICAEAYVTAALMVSRLLLFEVAANDVTGDVCGAPVDVCRYDSMPGCSTGGTGCDGTRRYVHAIMGQVDCLAQL